MTRISITLCLTALALVAVAAVAWFQQGDPPPAPARPVPAWQQPEPPPVTAPPGVAWCTNEDTCDAAR